MDELACLMDWDLHAIVQGCTSEGPSTIMDSPHFNFPSFCSEQDNLLLTFPEISETTSVLDELEELYKPFYPVLYPLSTQTIVTTSEPIPKASEQVQELKDPKVSECKKSKKKQNKRVVKEVRADEVSDTWAWRKYGQKPIKGSPYPRSYYRCSSIKGCSARKQVERSHLNPNVFIIIYTAEHNHPYPTRRNSLAGTTRNRKNNKLITSTPELTQTNIEETCSPKTSEIGSVEYELVQSVGLEKEDQLELLDDAQGQGTEITAMGTVEEDDDWLASLEELNGLSQQLALDAWFMDVFP